MKNKWEYTIIPNEVELRRRNGYYEFRPVVVEGTYLGAVAKAELFMQGGAWAPVPDYLMYKAKEAFKK